MKEYQETLMIHCVAPEEVQDGDLLAFIEGQASPAVRAHVARCAYCAQEAAALTRVGFMLAAAFDRAECPESDLLLGYQAGLLTTAENKRLKRHIKTCRDCQAELAEFMDKPLPSTRNQPATTLSQSLREIGKQVIEAVLLPNRPLPSLALRGESRQRAEYQAGSYQVILASVPPISGNKLWQVEGQLMGDLSGEMSGRVSLRRGEEPIASDNLDEFGFFALEQVPPGSYTLQIELPSALISLADLTIP